MSGLLANTIGFGGGGKNVDSGRRAARKNDADPNIDFWGMEGPLLGSDKHQSRIVGAAANIVELGSRKVV